MSERFEYFGEGHWSRPFPLGAYTTRVHIRGTVGVTPDGPDTQFNVQAEYFDENMVRRTETFGPSRGNSIDFDFWAGTDEGDAPQLHEPKIRIELPLNVPAGVTWYVANQTTVRPKQQVEKVDMSNLDAEWMRTGKK